MGWARAGASTALGGRLRGGWNGARWQAAARSFCGAPDFFTGLNPGKVLPEINMGSISTPAAPAAAPGGPAARRQTRACEPPCQGGGRAARRAAGATPRWRAPRWRRAPQQSCKARAALSLEHERSHGWRAGRCVRTHIATAAERNSRRRHTAGAPSTLPDLHRLFKHSASAAFRLRPESRCMNDSESPLSVPPPVGRGLQLLPFRVRPLPAPRPAAPAAGRRRTLTTHKQRRTPRSLLQPRPSALTPPAGRAASRPAQQKPPPACRRAGSGPTPG